MAKIVMSLFIQINDNVHFVVWDANIIKQF